MQKGRLRTSARVTTLWPRRSPAGVTLNPHRANMLLAGATRMGIAAVYTPSSKYKVYWAMILAEPDDKSE